nr:RNA-directed DNA polymerase, eukaryota, nucleotide-binding alpha-beta plait domain protein [Tanacetum cinerariifolium]
MYSHRSKEDQVSNISKSMFVTNFPDNFGSRDLWRLCESYGKVVDVFIPNRLSKAGKRFAFVRFIRVSDMDRLIGNLCTLWVNRYHLHANAVRYERPSKATFSVKNTFPNPPKQSGSFVNVVKGVKTQNNSPAPSFSLPSVVLNDSCVVTQDLSLHVMGKVKDLCSIPHIYSTLLNEGFSDVILSYLGGAWVLVEMDSLESKSKLLLHTGVRSWFEILQDATHDFVSEDRIVWVDFEGISLNLWSRETFVKIGKKWGEVLDIEENSCSSFTRKRVCIRTKQVESILESFKFIFKGKVYSARAKELFVWNPLLKGDNSSSSSDDESLLDDSVRGNQNLCNDDQVIESDEERVAKSSFTAFVADPPPHSSNLNQPNPKKDDHVSEDPFGIYNLLRRNHNDKVKESKPSLSHPPGFKTEIPSQNVDLANSLNKTSSASPAKEKESSHKFCPKVFNVIQENSDNVIPNSTSVNFSAKVDHEGSILDTLEDMIRIGQSMGYDMAGCSKDIERIIGEILCVWEQPIFKKDNVMISDNFIALFGTWLPSNTKVLLVAIYAPQSNVLKHTLWEYISLLISSWEGETLVMGYFNVVRSTAE